MHVAFHLAVDLDTSLKTAATTAGLADAAAFTPEVRTADPKHGDFQANGTLGYAKARKLNPRATAEQLVAALPASVRDAYEVSIVGPGFINFTLVAGHQFAIVKTIHEKQAAFARPNVGNGAKVLVEFVSANPTGPMHMGHCRGEVVGDALAGLLQYAGWDVTREYYINDAGSQIQTLCEWYKKRFEL